MRTLCPDAQKTPSIVTNSILKKRNLVKLAPTDVGGYDMRILLQLSVNAVTSVLKISPPHEFFALKFRLDGGGPNLVAFLARMLPPAAAAKQ